MDLEGAEVAVDGLRRPTGRLHDRGERGEPPTLLETQRGRGAIASRPRPGEPP